MTAWTRSYIKETWPMPLSDERTQQRTVEAIVALHRFREDRPDPSYRYFVLPNPKVPDEVLIGFTRDISNGVEEEYILGSGGRMVDDATLAMVDTVFV